MVASTPNGRITYSGRPVPAIDVRPDLTGNWNATKKVKGISFVEFFPVAPADLGYAGIYQISGGTGPGYTTDGAAMLSSRRKIAFQFRSLPTTVEPDSTNAVYTMYTSFGSFAKLRGGYSASTVGIQGATATNAAPDRISFNAFFVPPPPVTSTLGQ